MGCPPGPNGLPGGIPYCGPPNGWPCDGKCGLPAPGGTNGGPEEPGRPTNCGGAPDGDPNGLGPGPLYGGPVLFGGGGKPAELGGGPGPGVDEPLGAGDAVYCGVAEPGGPWYGGAPAGLPALPGNGLGPWKPALLGGPPVLLYGPEPGPPP